MTTEKATPRDYADRPYRLDYTSSGRDARILQGDVLVAHAAPGHNRYVEALIAEYDALRAVEAAVDAAAGEHKVRHPTLDENCDTCLTLLGLLLPVAALDALRGRLASASIMAASATAAESCNAP